MEVYFPYVRKRREFGKHAEFATQEADVLFDLRPNEEYAQEHIERNPGHVGVQAVADMCEHEANTSAVHYTATGMNHQEGGWPKEVDCNEAESVIRYRKKIEKDEHYIKTVVKLAGVVEGLLKANNAIDIYEEYFPELPPEPASSGPAEARTISMLHDPCGGNRGAQYVSWHPDGARRLAVAYSILEFQKQPADMPLASAVWDLNNTTEPDVLLQPVSQLTCLNYNLKDMNVLGAGMYNGQFGVFDPRKGTAPVDLTPIEQSHRDPVYDFAWQQSKTGTEAMTVSTDGSAFWWDIRRLGEPLESLSLVEKGASTAAGAVSLDYTIAAGPTKFMVGTETGAILSCNRKGKTPADRVGASYPGHHGPVYGLHRHPVFTKFFLSMGDWSARLWNEDLRSPIITSPYQHAYLTSGRWSPTRPGVFFTAKANGCLDVWDYFEKQHEPTLTLDITKAALTTVRVREGGTDLAVGAADGTVSIVRVSAALSEMQPNEKANISAMLERESSREKNLEKAAKDAKARARRAAEAAKAAKADGATSSAAEADAIAKAEADFFKMTGLAPPAAEEQTADAIL